MKRWGMLLTVFPGLVIACAGGQTQSGAVANPRSNNATTRGGANVLSGEELVRSSAENALQAIKLLRPTMLRARGGSLGDPTGSTDIVVYLDGVKAGGPSSLEFVPTMSVREIRAISAADATVRFGTGHTMGAILVTTKR